MCAYMRRFSDIDDSFNYLLFAKVSLRKDVKISQSIETTADWTRLLLILMVVNRMMTA